MKLKTIAAMATLILLAGCATWTNLDGSKASQEQVNTAKSKCNHDSTLLKLQTTELTKDAKVLATSDLNEKKALEEAYEAEEKAVRNKLNACMKSQGLKPLL